MIYVKNEQTKNATYEITIMTENEKIMQIGTVSYSVSKNNITWQTSIYERELYQEILKNPEALAALTEEISVFKKEFNEVARKYGHPTY